MTGKQLRNLRLMVGLSGRLICNQSGVERSRLSDIERGYVEPKPPELARIEKAISDLTRAKERVAVLAAEVGWPM